MDRRRRVTRTTFNEVNEVPTLVMAAVNRGFFSESNILESRWEGWGCILGRECEGVDEESRRRKLTLVGGGVEDIRYGRSD